MVPSEESRARGNSGGWDQEVQATAYTVSVKDVLHNTGNTGDAAQRTWSTMYVSPKLGIAALFIREERC